MKKLIAIILILVLALSIAACGGSDDEAEGLGQLDAIKERGVLNVGVKVDVPGFGYQDPDSGENEGMEIDLAKAMAKDILGDENAVEYFAVTAQTRGPMLDNNEVDMIIATFTITDERKESYNFTEAYYVDEIGFLVKKDSGFKTIKDLDGKNIAVAQSATTKDSLMQKAEELGIEFNYQEYTSYPEMKSALVSNRVDAFSVDKSILLGYVDDSTMIIEEGFNPQEYGIATKLDNKELAGYFNEKVAEMKGDGTLQEFIDKWGLNSVE